MSRIGVVALAALFAFSVGTAHAQTSTPPGQEKKETGATSAKEMAPGHDEHAGKAEHGKAEHGKKKAEHKAKGKSKAPSHTQKSHHGKKAEPKTSAAPATEPGSAAAPK